MRIVRSRLSPVALLVASAFLLGGCVGFRGPEDVRAGLERSHGITLDRESGFSVGPLGILVANVFVPNDVVPFSLGDLHSVEIGEYHLSECSAGTPFDVHALSFPDWEPIVRMRDGTEVAMVLLDADDDSIDRLLLVQRDGDEVLIVRAKGRLDRVLDALLEHGLAETDVSLASAGH